MTACWAPVIEKIPGYLQCNTGGETLTIGGQGRKLLGRAAQLEVLWAGRDGKARGFIDGGNGREHDGRAVGEAAGVVAEHGELGHGRFERLNYELLLVNLAGVIVRSRETDAFEQEGRPGR